MLVVGLTGGIASGKTVVANMFRSLGTELIDADAISRELVHPGAPCWREIVDHFGESILGDDSRLNRKRLAEIIFRDSDARVWLNRLLHPQILELIRERIGRVQQQNPRRLIVVEAALLIETGTYKEFDRVVVVAANEQTQRVRLMERDGLNLEEAKRRIETQLPIKEKVKVADYVIDNEGSLEEVKRQVVELYRTFISFEPQKRT
jgi:dephospho-CoA kinase